MNKKLNFDDPMDTSSSPSVPTSSVQNVAQPKISSVALAELIEQLARALQQSCFAEGLIPAQWGAMRYFARANPTACTVTGLANGMMTTKGSTSQTVSALRRKRLLEARRDRTDQRVVYLALSRKGQELLAKDPLNQLVKALESLPAETLLASAGMVEATLKVLFNTRHAKRTSAK